MGRQFNVTKGKMDTSQMFGGEMKEACDSSYS